jgi:hypothetical protein
VDEKIESIIGSNQDYYQRAKLEIQNWVLQLLEEEITEQLSMLQ